MNHVRKDSAGSSKPRDGSSAKVALPLCDSMCSDINRSENKKGTYNKTALVSDPLASCNHHTDLNIERVWREVVDFGETGCGNGEEGWGRKHISVARVSILDGPPNGKGRTTHE